MRNDKASVIAFDIMEDLSHLCSKILIGGSIRRREPEVKDIVIVTQPLNKPIKDLFSEQDHYPLLEYVRKEFIEKDESGFEKRKLIKGEQRYFQFALVEGIALDLFVVMPPAEWGVIATLRTGPVDFSKRCVTPANMSGGLLPPGYICSNGAIMSQFSKKIVPMPTEADFFKFLKIDFIEPWDRK